MNFLSPQIEAMVEKKGKNGSSLIKKGYSCGIFQDYGEDRETVSVSEPE